jgi:LmbE family N-acetylglucosaminyl deacetylase
VDHDTHALVIAPHPDDAEFGAAGTVARWTREGRSVVYALCTSGEKGTTDPAVAPPELARVREAEQQAAADILNVRTVVFLRYPDQGLEDTAAFRKAIVRLIRQFRPHTVLTTDPYRRYLWHRDHRITGQAVCDALYPFARDHLAYPDLLEDGLLPHKVREALFWGAEEINYRTDITDTFDLKLAALQCHKSQIKEFNIPDMDGWLRQRCRDMADGENIGLAEGFHRRVMPP